jgi:hypothetical protein
LTRHLPGTNRSDVDLTIPRPIDQLEEDNHEGYPYSYVEKHWDDMYLELRSPISVHVNVGYSLRNDKDTNKPNAQSVRVSKFLISTFKWQRKLMLGLCEGEKGGPFCMSQLGRLLGTSRIPTYGRDRLRFTPDSRHIVVMRHNIFYRVDVMSEDGSSIISQDQLQKQLQHIINTTKEGEVPGNDSATFLEGCGVGILTMEDRNLWAHHREALKANSVHNRFVLSTINSALLVVCFDKSSPNNMTERSQALLHGTQSSICNRWFDKFQVIADDDGNVGINFEHSHADGVSWNRWLTEVRVASQQICKDGCIICECTRDFCPTEILPHRAAFRFGMTCRERSLPPACVPSQTSL